MNIPPADKCPSPVLKSTFKNATTLRMPSITSSQNEDGQSVESSQSNNTVQQSQDQRGGKTATGLSKSRFARQQKREDEAEKELEEEAKRLTFPQSAFSRFRVNIESTASKLSKLTFSWTIHILKVGRLAARQQRNLLDTELFDCGEEEAPGHAFDFMKMNFTKRLREENSKYMQARSEFVRETARSKKDRTFEQTEFECTQQKFEEQRKQIEGLLYQSLYAFGSAEYILATGLSIIANLCQFAGPFFLKQIVKLIKSSDFQDSVWEGYFYAAMIFLIFLFRVFLQQHSMQITNRVALKVQNAINTCVFDKILTLSSSAKKYYDTGKMMTLVTVDSSSIFGYVMMAQNMVTSPIMVVVSVAFIVYELGVIGFATPVFFVLGAYLQKLVNVRAFRLRRLILSWTDKRSKQLNEFFESIRVVKYNGWEDMISSRIGDIRIVETKNLLLNQIIKTVVEVIMNATPFVISLFIFGMYVLINDGEFDSASAYTVLTLLNLLLNPLKMIVIVQLLQQNAITSLTRITEFLMAEDKPNYKLEELQPVTTLNNNQKNESKQKEIAVSIQQSDFAWESLKSVIHCHTSRLIRPLAMQQPAATASQDKKNSLSRQVSLASHVSSPVSPAFVLTPTENQAMRDMRVLKGIELSVEVGDTIAIVGSVASGKSSLLLAILGEMVHIEGKISVHGSVAYIPQSAWLINASFKENILFGLPFEEEKYANVIKFCQLEADLENQDTFPEKDGTVIGERGSNLSGGQRQRIGIARAVYSDADIFLIDDCLSALDAAVANAIFTDLLCDYLKNKTIVFVTHALHFIEKISKIIVVKDGEIVSRGSHEELVESSHEYQRLTQVFAEKSKEDDENEEGNEDFIGVTEMSDDEDDDGDLQEEEYEDDFEEYDEEEEKLAYGEEGKNQDEKAEIARKKAIEFATSFEMKERSMPASPVTHRNKIRIEENKNDPEMNQLSTKKRDGNAPLSEEERIRVEMAVDRMLRKRFDRIMRKNHNNVEMHSEVADFNFSAVQEKHFQEREFKINTRNVMHSQQLQRQQTIVKKIGLKKQRGRIIQKATITSRSRKKHKIRRTATIKLADLIDNDPQFEQSAVPLSVYQRYIKSGGVFATISMLLSFLLAQGLKVFSDWWIGVWSSNSLDLSTGEYIYVFAILGVLQTIFIYLRGYAFGVFTINASNSFQKKLVEKLLHTPQWWYDITPIGKILSRTTKDQDDLDSSLPWNLKFALTNIFSLLVVTVTIAIVFPYFIVIGVLAFYAYYVVVKFYMVTSREIKSLEAAARSPVLSNYQETASGLIVIRAFRRESMFIEKTLKLQRDHLVAQLNQNSCNRWVSVITDLLGLLVVTSCAFFGIISTQFELISDASLVALALSSSFQISQIISFTLKLLADTESNMNALVRIMKFIDENPEENAWHESKPPANWPTQGALQFTNVSLRYRSDLPQVLSNLNLSIKPFEKIGVVGRTGCGKSTLTLGILRILEMTFDENNELGQIMLDDVDIRDIGIHELRQKVTIIPQEPILFSGTLRSNMDPFNQFSDSDIVEALKKVSIWDQLDRILEQQSTDHPRKQQSNHHPKNLSQKQLADASNKKLHLSVDIGGGNFSLGQRQLICIARALIKKPKVLLMDEATASIDEMTDSIIQNIIKEDLKKTTVITIAHRLKTIISYDRILVLEKGSLKEFDTPFKLLTSSESYFKSLVNENGAAFFEEMRILAVKKEEERIQVPVSLRNIPSDVRLPSERSILENHHDFNLPSPNNFMNLEEKGFYNNFDSQLPLPFASARAPRGLKFRRKSLLAPINPTIQMKTILLGKHNLNNSRDVRKEFEAFSKMTSISNNNIAADTTVPSLRETERDRRESFPFIGMSDPRIPEEVEVQREDTLQEQDAENEDDQKSKQITENEHQLTE